MLRFIIFPLITLLISMNTHASALSLYTSEYTPDDVLTFTRIDYVTVSPDTKQIAYVTVSRDQIDRSKLRYALNLKNNNGTISEITHSSSISSVSWAPDQKSIAYIAPNESGQQVIAIYHVAEKTITPLVTLSRGIVGLRWSPSGKQIAFIAEDDKSTSSNDGFKVLPSPMNNLRLYLVDINKPQDIKVLTPAEFSISYDPFTRGFSWSPMHNKIAFAYQASTKATDDIQPNIAILDLMTNKLSHLTYCKAHTCRQPIYSPDGKWLAFTANILATPKTKAKALLQDIEIRNKVCLINAVGQMHCLQDTYNTNPWLIEWNATSDAVYVGEPFKSHGINIYKLSENPKIPVKLISTHKDFIEPLTLSLNQSKQVFGLGYEKINEAPEVYTSSVDHFNLQKITHFNEKYNKTLGEVHVLNWKSLDGTPVEGLLITPSHYDLSHAYPLYVDVHGGPSGAQAIRYIGGCDEYGEGFIPTSCAANILSLGYVVLQVNYRGSSGYGLNFRIKDFADLGGGDYNDILTGIDYVAEHFKIDEQKIVISGWSAGGYMAAWAIGHTNKFSLAIDGDGISDFISYSATTDDTDYGLRYLGVNFWDDHHLYWVHSPLAYVKNMQTPLFIIHGEQDIRVPLSQGKELLTSLTLLNRPVKMLIAPNQGHVPTDIETFSKELLAIDQVLKNGLN